MSILFINASPNHDGNTAHLAKELLENHPYTRIDLVDYKIYGYGQTFDDDQIDEVLAAIRNADSIVDGSPVYWHNITGRALGRFRACSQLHATNFRFRSSTALFSYRPKIFSRGDYTVFAMAEYR